MLKEKKKQPPSIYTSLSLKDFFIASVSGAVTAYKYIDILLFFKKYETIIYSTKKKAEGDTLSFSLMCIIITKRASRKRRGVIAERIKQQQQHDNDAFYMCHRNPSFFPLCAP